MKNHRLTAALVSAFFFATLGVATSAVAQDILPCGQVESQAAFDAAHPGEAAARMEREADIRTKAAELLQRGGEDNELYVIPVVFHIIHDNGPENISNEQVYDAMEVLNRDFRLMNADTGQIVAGFVDIAADVDIEFRLAKRDPQGNCHSGINRIASLLTYEGTNEMKQLINWPRASYMNVYVCSEAAGAAGYTNYPSEWGANTDGIVLKHEYVGSIGTSNPYRSRTLTHECGHWLNLPHTWGSSNNPNEPDNCEVDDGVEDTPLCLGSPVGFCDLERTTCGSLDNVQNYMEYSYCSRMYTLGQRARMRAALNSNVADRNQLWTPNNIQETGVFEEALLCNAAFEVDRFEACIGEDIQFTDQSFFGISNWSWDFGDGTVLEGGVDSLHRNPIHQYQEAGEFEVYLTVSNGNGSITSVDPVIITIMDDGVLPPMWQDGFEAGVGPWASGLWEVQTLSGQPWQIRETTGFSGARSLYVRNRNNETGDITRTTSTTYNAEGMAAVMIGYKYAYSHRATGDTDDRLKLQVSRDCGQTWNTRQFHRGLIDLSTAPNHGGNFYPSGPSEWAGHIEEVDNQLYMVPKLRIRFEFESKGGNNVFLDDINVYGVDSLGNVLGLDPIDSPSGQVLIAYPNPGRGSVTVQAMWAAGDAQLRLRDAVGRIERHIPLRDAQGQTVQLNGLSTGIHLLELLVEDRREVIRLVVTE